MEDLNTAAMLRARDAWNAGHQEAYLELYHPEIVLYGYAEPIRGSNGLRDFYNAFWAAFPGCRLEFDDLFAAGDRIACRFTVSGQHNGPFQGLAPTGRKFSLTGITILRFSEGRCVERWSQADLSGLMAQLSA
jgi:predicted ester cyclase